MYTHEEIVAYRCPRWEDWPDLDLYMDQVISLVEEQVAGFYPPDQKKIVTATMINNYVKQKIVQPSKNKKYTRGHLAHLYILFFLKPALSLGDICDGITRLTKKHTIEESYDAFCNEIEAAIGSAFCDEQKDCSGNDTMDGIEIIRALVRAFSYTLLARVSLSAELGKQRICEEEKKEKEKKK